LGALPHRDVLRAAVVGAGTGGMLSIQALQSSERYDLVGVADVSGAARSRAAELGVTAEMFADAGSMLETVEPEVVCISTFAPSHAELVGQALDAGVRGVLLEKPVALDWASGRATLDRLRERQVPVVVPHGLLVRPASKEVLRHISEGVLGDLELIEIECRGWDLMNAGVHWVDFALAALGDDHVQKVLAACDVSTRTFRDGIEVETEAITYAVTGTGVRLVMQTGDDVRPAREGKELVYRFYGSLGSIEFWGWEDRYWLRVDQGRTLPAVTNTSPLTSTAHHVYLEMLAEMVEKREPQYELAELSLRALEICDAAYVSHRYRCAVGLPLSMFMPPPGPALQLAPDRAPGPEWGPGTPYRGRGGRNGRLL
jgi:predicted dehydrogenase